MTQAGAVMIGGAVVATGSWAAQTIANFFSRKSETEQRYEDAKARGGQTDNHSYSYGRE